MSYVGNTPADKFLTLEKQSFSVSATTGYTLSHSVSSPQDIRLVINNVPQNPNSSYTVSGTALTLSSATSSGDTMYCVFLGKAIGTVAPAVGSVTNAMLSGSIATSKLADGSTFGQTNTPAFFVYLGSNQTISSNTYTKITFDTEIVDTNNNFASNRFTPTTSGKYIIYANVCFDASSSQFAQGGTAIYKNGSILYETFNNQTSNNANTISLPIQVLVDANGSGDYFEIFAKCTDSSGSPVISAGNRRTTFGAYKLIGV